MDEQAKYYLKEDIKSTFNPKVTYGKQGDKVTEIARTDHVLIVEDKKGERFPVSIERLTKIN